MSNISNKVDVNAEDMATETLRATDASGNKARVQLSLEGSGLSKRNEDFNRWFVESLGGTVDDSE